MKLLCGRTIPYMYVDEGDIDDEKEFVAIDAIKKMFGKQYDESVWNAVSISIDRNSIGDQVSCFFQDKREPLSVVFNEWAEDQEHSVGDYEFFYDRKRINGSDTPMMLGMRRDNDIEALHKEKLLLLVRDSSGHETLYIHDKSNMLSYLMQSHADGTGVEKSSFVFLCNGKRVFGHEHAREFDLDHYAVIDVIPAGIYKCDKCTCCYPKQATFTFA